MDELRLILLGVGALVVAGVYLYSRYSPVRDENADSDDPEHARREPGVGKAADDSELDDDLPSISTGGRPADSSAAAESTAAAKPRSSNAQNNVQKKEKLIVLNILPVKRDGFFHGNDLLEVFDRAGLEYGRFDVFHRMIETADGLESVFSVASATEPGSFEISEMADESFKGLSMFMLLPGPQPGVAAFADMLATARRMAQQLNADVTDRNRSSMTRQTAHHIREDIIAFEHQFKRDPD